MNKPELIHFQLTRNCNLRCYFCGQWGKKGFFSGADGEEMTLSDWKKLALDIKSTYTPLPHIMLWGGEPLVCPYFDELVMLLKEQGFILGMITNGVLLDEHMEICKSSFKKIFVSIDGPEDIHDSIRGEGVFKKAITNLKKLSDSDVYVTVSSVLSPGLLGRLEEFIKIIENSGVNELLLQNYIRVSKEEADEYKKWMKDCFNIKATEIDTWISQLPDDYEEKKEKAIREIKAKKFKIDVNYLPHNNEDCVCMSANKHIHVSWKGNVLYCTDFYDFNAGNVKEQHIDLIFNNEISEAYRNNVKNNPTCKHCSWRPSKEYWL